MPVIKSLPLTIGSGTLAAGDTSSCHGVDVGAYIRVGLDLSFQTSATDGEVYIKVYGLNTSDYETQEKFNIITYAVPVTNQYQHLSIDVLDYLYLCVVVVNNANASIDYTVKMVGVRVS